MLRPGEEEITTPSDSVKSMERDFSKVSEAFLKKDIKIEKPTTIDTESPINTKKFFENLK